MFEKTRFYQVVDRREVFIALHDAVQHAKLHEDTVTEVNRSRKHRQIH